MKELGYTEIVNQTTQYLPFKVVQPPKDAIKTFSHTKRVGNYLLGQTLGEGSFAKVKEALHVPTGEKVAIKVIDKKRAKSDSYVRKNLRREGKLLQMVRHPNIVKLLEIMETENSYYLVTELCQGGDFMDYICKKKKLEEKEGKKYVRQIVSAVDYLHRLGILHRDLKIENLLLDSNKDLKIIDFGLSNCIKVSPAEDGSRAQEFCVTQCGSPAYAAPELLSHQKYGPQVDVWSIGVNMFAMLTGSLPFTVEPFNIKALHNKMVMGHINPVPDYLSRECRDLLRKLLCANPDKRVTITEAMKHVWLSEGKSGLFERHPCPNKLRTDELDSDILKHMCHNLGFRMGEIIRFCTGNIPSAANATYHMFLKKLRRYNADLRVKGKTPATDSRLMEPTRISLIFHELPQKRTSVIPAGVKILRRRGGNTGSEVSDSATHQLSNNTALRFKADTTVTENDHNTQTSDNSNDTPYPIEGKDTQTKTPVAVTSPTKRTAMKTTNIQQILCSNPTWLRKACHMDKKTMSDDLSKLNKLLSPRIKSTTYTETKPSNEKSRVIINFGKRFSQPKSGNNVSDSSSSLVSHAVASPVSRDQSKHVVDLKPLSTRRSVQINLFGGSISSRPHNRHNKICDIGTATKRPVSPVQESTTPIEDSKKSRTYDVINNDISELDTHLISTDHVSGMFNSKESISKIGKLERGSSNIILPAIAATVITRNQ